jgi:hypothetical protein
MKNIHTLPSSAMRMQPWHLVCTSSFWVSSHHANFQSLCFMGHISLH